MTSTAKRLNVLLHAAHRKMDASLLNSESSFAFLRRSPPNNQHPIISLAAPRLCFCCFHHQSRKNSTAPSRPSKAAAFLSSENERTSVSVLAGVERSVAWPPSRGQSSMERSKQREGGKKKESSKHERAPTKERPNSRQEEGGESARARETSLPLFTPGLLFRSAPPSPSNHPSFFLSLSLSFHSNKQPLRKHTHENKPRKSETGPVLLQ